MLAAVEPLVANYADDWPGWGHRKIYGLMRADGITVSASSVQRAMRRRGLLQPIDYQGVRRELAKARKAAFAEAPTGPNQVWQLDILRVRDHHRRDMAPGRCVRLLLQVRVRLAHRAHLHRR